MSKTTREQLLDVAERQFAERGFYGVSIAAVADELSLTKQALLHHFRTKEKLYGSVLERISRDYEQALNDLSGQSDVETAEQLTEYLVQLAEDACRHSARTQLLMRELLDNKRRAETASTWYLQSYLETLTNRMGSLPGWSKVSSARVFARLYQLLGAINYYAISQPTLRAILGAEEADAVRSVFSSELRALLEAPVN
ncbi:MAG: TetR/AcrR family transcriptional regulator [Parvularculaceae bacterium]|nr:TetR/AcrR family transcriptional regulator [Parvularculaceae bacterium]